MSASTENQTNDSSSTARNDNTRKGESGAALTGSRHAQSAEVLAGRTNPFGLMRTLMDDLDRLMSGLAMGGSITNELFRAPARRALAAMWVPPVTVFERDGAMVVRADVPGLSPEQVDVQIQNGRLTISGERSEERDTRDSGVYRNERSYGAFRRVIMLPDGIDAESATATFDNGVLEVSVPAPERKRAQRIEVKTVKREVEGMGTTGGQSSAPESASAA